MPGPGLCGCVLVSGLGLGHVEAGWHPWPAWGVGFGYAFIPSSAINALAKYEPLTVTVWTFIIASLGSCPSVISA